MVYLRNVLLSCCMYRKYLNIIICNTYIYNIYIGYFPDYYGYGPSSNKLQTTFGFVFTCHVIGYHFESIVVDYYANESKV